MRISMEKLKKLHDDYFRMLMRAYEIQPEHEDLVKTFFFSMIHHAGMIQMPVDIAKVVLEITEGIQHGYVDFPDDLDCMAQRALKESCD